MHVVGIGASAGGLESLERLFEHIPPDTGMAFVVVQHLSPDFKSMMEELLGRRTRMPVHRIEDGMEVRPNHVYVLVPRKIVGIEDGRLRLTEKEGPGISLPIDHFLTSLAEERKERSVAIILSGSGSDGSRGLRAVSNAGGLVLCESLDTARFDGMPKAAQGSGLVDLTLAPEQMGAALVRHTRGDAREGVTEELGLERTVADEIVALLRKEFDLDFSLYKPATVTRRIERRLSLSDSRGLEEYLERLRKEPAELSALYHDLLIGVTGFFRDQECYDALEAIVLPRIFSQVPPGETIRIWIAACATGEEAYSIAILVHEALERAGRPIELKVFATDVHRRSLDFASLGRFPKERVTGVSPERLRRYFSKRHDGYQVSQDLRQLIVFAPHNLLKDAPFTGLDLVTCRNLLIYFLPPAQRRALALMHFGLKVGGALMLGASESPGQLADEFDVLDDRHKLYVKKRDVRMLTDVRVAMTPTATPPVSAAALPGGRSPIQGKELLDTYDQLLDRFMPPSFLVSGERELLDSFGGAEKFLRLTKRRPSNDFLELLQPDLKMAVAGALQRVATQGGEVRYSGLRLHPDEEDSDRSFRLRAEALGRPNGSRARFLVTLEEEASTVPSRFQEAPDQACEDYDVGQASSDRIRVLEEELQNVRENLQTTIEELETSNEELQATNEELVASNEELQSTNEELHSVNEELYTVNAEHQRKIAELDELNKDMNHLLASSDVATVFLDGELRIRKFTPAVAQLFELVPHDMGRRLTAFTHRLTDAAFASDLEAVLESGERIEREVETVGGRRFFMRILPYTTGEEIEGIVLTLIDISALASARGRLDHLSAIVESSHDAIISLSEEGRIKTWNDAAEQLYGYTAEEAVGRDVRMLVPPAAEEELRELLTAVAAGERRTLEGERVRKDGARLVVSASLSPVQRGGAEVVGVSLIERDITEQKEMASRLVASEEKYQDLYDHAPDLYASIDAQRGTILGCNKTFLSVLGYAREQVEGRFALDLHAPASRGEAERVFAAARSDGDVQHGELELLKSSGQTVPVSLRLSVLRNEDGQPKVLRSVWRDVTDRKRAEDEVRSALLQRDRFLAILSHELRNPLHSTQAALHLWNRNPGSERVMERVRGILERQISQASRLLDDLLDITRITHGKIELRTELINLADVALEAIESVQSLHDGDHQFQLEAPSRVPIDADRSRVLQIISNLLVNAVKYSPSGSPVEIAVRSEGGMGVLSVRDHGEGLSKELQGALFTLFVQSDRTLDRSRGGLGVGLALVRSLVELHGGSADAYSEGPGKGSTFTVRFPLAVEEPFADRGEAPDEPVNGRRVVIVEDQEDTREVLHELLELEGFEVVSAADGEEGLALILKERPEVAVVDIGLPKLDGYEVGRRVRAELGDDGPCLIAVSGYGQTSDIDKSKSAGFDLHRVKPVDVGELTKLLRTAVRKRA